MPHSNKISYNILMLKIFFSNLFISPTYISFISFHSLIIFVIHLTTNYSIIIIHVVHPIATINFPELSFRKLTNYFRKMIGGRCQVAFLSRSNDFVSPKRQKNERRRKPRVQERGGTNRQLVSSTKHFLLVPAGIVLTAIRYAKKAKQPTKYTLISFAAPTGIAIKPAW